MTPTKPGERLLRWESSPDCTRRDLNPEHVRDQSNDILTRPEASILRQEEKVFKFTMCSRLVQYSVDLPEHTEARL